MLLSFCRIAVYKAVYPTAGTEADVIAAIDQVSDTVYLKPIRSIMQLDQVNPKP